MRDTNQAIRRNLLTALSFIVLFGGTAGAWSTLVPIARHVQGQGTIDTDIKSQKVQHPTGGVVGWIGVKEGQMVKSGDVVARLDDTMTRANLGVIMNDLTAASARIARLETELTQIGRELNPATPAPAKADPKKPALPAPAADTGILFPADLVQRAAREPEITKVLESERLLFESRRSSRIGQKGILKTRIQQQRDQLIGIDEQMKSQNGALAVAKDEAKRTGEVFGAEHARVLGIRKEMLRLEGSLGELNSQKAQIAGRITETEQQILQVDQDALTEVTKDQREVTTKRTELTERRIAAEDQLRRVDIRSPVNGIVHQLAAHTIGGVISPTDTLMQVVPESEKVIVEVKIQISEIGQVRMQQPTKLRFSSLPITPSPEADGVVFRLPAADIKEQQTGANYYVVGVSIPASEIAKLKDRDVKLVPGLQVDAFLSTGQSTFMEMISSQLTTAFAQVLNR